MLKIILNGAIFPRHNVIQTSETSLMTFVQPIKVLLRSCTSSEKGVIHPEGYAWRSRFCLAVLCSCIREFFYLTYFLLDVSNKAVQRSLKDLCFIVHPRRPYLISGFRASAWAGAMCGSRSVTSGLQVLVPSRHSMESGWLHVLWHQYYNFEFCHIMHWPWACRWWRNWWRWRKTCTKSEALITWLSCWPVLPRECERLSA